MNARDGFTKTQKATMLLSKETLEGLRMTSKCFTCICIFVYVCVYILIFILVR